MPPAVKTLRLQIEPVVAKAEEVARTVQEQLQSHEGLRGAAMNVAEAARQAQVVSRRMRRPWSLHRLPVWFLAAALLGLLIWTYWRFVHVAQLTVALPNRDAIELRRRIRGDAKVKFIDREVRGSPEAVRRVAAGEVDLAFVQGGVEIPEDLPRQESPGTELVLWLVRKDKSLSGVRTVLTSDKDQGSHLVAQQFFRTWQVASAVEYRHEWTPLATEDEYAVPEEVDAVFAVKDPADEKTLRAVNRLTQAGFEFRTPDLGSRAGRLDFLVPATIPPAYLNPDPRVPESPIETYAVKTYIVARKGLTPRLLAEAARLLDSTPDNPFEANVPTVSDASEIFQGVEAFLGILVNIGLAFLALMGLETVAYQKRYHELNSLVSLLSMLQSNKDVLGLSDSSKKSENLLYLSLCSDLLGLVSMISGYYTQENAGLLSNHLSEIVHQRCDGLKINIQLKILHAGVRIAPETVPPPAEPPPVVGEAARAPAGSPP